MIRRLYLVGLLALLTGLAYGQSFNSGSNGSDGPLNITSSRTFDPAALNLNAAGDNVFNFTTINIGPGAVVKLLNGPLRGKPVVWLASGAVTIAGTLDLSGLPGQDQGSPNASRHPADPGPGGYPGGIGAIAGSPNTDGFGPGGGLTGRGCFGNAGEGDSGGGGHGTPGTTSGGAKCGVGGVTYGNVVLVPLRGGSGGGGGVSGGGGGGGALRIESSVSISVTGSILADGGAGGVITSGIMGGGGSGGAIHLIAPNITGGGTLSARGGVAIGQGGFGRIRVDAFSQQFSGTSNPPSTFGPPYAVPLPTAQPTVRVTSIGGITLPPSPTGSFLTPDVVINQSGPVTISIQASNVPIGTVVTLRLFSELAPDLTILSTGLAGPLQNSTATAQATFQPGYTSGLVQTKW